MPNMVYQWRNGTRLGINAQQAGEAIDLLTRKANGALTPAAVVNAARNEESVLHSAFEWDDAVAAEAHREDQARYLIGSLVVTVRPANTPREVRAFVNVVCDNEQGYVPLHTAMSDVDLRAQVVRRAWSELQAWRERYAGYSELASVHAAIDADCQKRKSVA